MLMRLDHLAVSASTLAQGVAYVEDVLGVSLDGGGQHPHMGTHNRLLSLGPEIYLEVIAIDPAGAVPGRARWFDLDNFAGAPRLTNWIAQCDDLSGALAAMPAVDVDVLDLERGDLRWQMAVPADGCVPFDGACPALISWGGTAHPAGRLHDHGCRLQELLIFHPEADALRGVLAPVMDMSGVRVQVAEAVGFEAHISTPSGAKVLR